MANHQRAGYLDRTSFHKAMDLISIAQQVRAWGLSERSQGMLGQRMGACGRLLTVGSGGRSPVYAADVKGAAGLEQTFLVCARPRRTVAEMHVEFVCAFHAAAAL